MGSLVEVVFEEVTPAQALAIAQRLGDVRAEESLREAVRRETDGVDEIALGDLSISPRVVVANAHLRVLRYEHRLDVEINFDLDDVAGAGGMELQRSLWEFVRDAGGTAGVTNYYAGLEPASDLETRLFTGDRLGPLFLKSSDLDPKSQG